MTPEDVSTICVLKCVPLYSSGDYFLKGIFSTQFFPLSYPEKIYNYNLKKKKLSKNHCSTVMKSYASYPEPVLRLPGDEKVNRKGQGRELVAVLEHTPLWGIRLELSSSLPNCTLGPKSSTLLCHVSAQNVSGDAQARKIKFSFVITTGGATLKARQEGLCISQILKHKHICFVLFGLKTKFFAKVYNSLN